MPLVSSSRIDGAPTCTRCQAGRLLSFNWDYAHQGSARDLGVDTSAFMRELTMRVGELYVCAACAQPWYLWGQPRMMCCVPPERVALLRRWNEHVVTLDSRHLPVLRAIGRTPPDVYGNGADYCVVPCAVITTSGERCDPAMVSLQRHAPFETWRPSRLAAEIADIEASPYALPLGVRVATSRADEVRMGFAPTIVDLPTGESAVLNWTQNVFVSPGVDATRVTVADRPPDWRRMPPVYHGPKDLVYFVATFP